MRAVTTRLPSKGQVIIPGAIRRRLGLDPGAEFVVVGNDDTIVLNRVTLAVTHTGETECMHRPFPGARLLRQSQAPATEPSHARTLWHGKDALQERRGARRTSELRIICQHRDRSLSPVHEQVGIGCVNVAAARGVLQNEADG